MLNEFWKQAIVFKIEKVNNSWGFIEFCTATPSVLPLEKLEFCVYLHFKCTDVFSLKAHKRNVTYVTFVNK